MLKRLAILGIILILSMILSGCTDVQHEHDYSVWVSMTSSTCIAKGERVLQCSQCEETITEELPLGGHKVAEWEIILEPTAEQYGEKRGICSVCNEMISSYVDKLGTSSDSPLDMDVKKFYQAICNGKFDDYDGRYVQLTGKVTYISSYSDMIGYYLYGKKGQGVCCWVYSFQTKEQLANVGDTVTFVGKVQNEGDRHVELTYCKLITE